MRASRVVAIVALLVCTPAWAARSPFKPEPRVAATPSWPKSTVILGPLPLPEIPEGALEGEIAVNYKAWLAADQAAGEVARELRALDRAIATAEGSRSSPGADEIAVLHAALSQAVARNPALGERIDPLVLTGELTVAAREPGLPLAQERLEAWRARLVDEVQDHKAEEARRAGALAAAVDPALGWWHLLVFGLLMERASHDAWMADYAAYRLAVVAAGAVGAAAERPVWEDEPAWRAFAAVAHGTEPAAAELGAWRAGFLLLAPEATTFDPASGAQRLSALVGANPTAALAGRARVLLTVDALQPQGRGDKERAGFARDLATVSQTEPALRDYADVLLARACERLDDLPCVLDGLGRAGADDPFAGEKRWLAGRALWGSFGAAGIGPPRASAVREALYRLGNDDLQRAVLVEATDQLAARQSFSKAQDLGRITLDHWPLHAEAPVLALRLARLSLSEPIPDPVRAMAIAEWMGETYGPGSMWRVTQGKVLEAHVEEALEMAARLEAGDALPPVVTDEDGGDGGSVAAVAARQTPGIQACAELARSADRPPLGRLDLRLHTSRPVRIEVLHDAIFDAELLSCVQGEVSRWRFDESLGEQSFTHSFIFLD